MGKLDPNSIIGILQGKLGNLVFVRRKNGQVIVRRRPVRNSDATAPERANQAVFREALRYVSRVRRDALLYARYVAAAQRADRRACDLANADFRCPPAIHDLDLSGYTGRAGESILIQAVDDFEVARVHVTIRGQAGEVLESGAADLEGSSSLSTSSSSLPREQGWRYTAQRELSESQTVTIEVLAADLAGNLVTKAALHTIAPNGVGTSTSH